MKLPSFDKVFAAVHGRTPFPWQRRLVDEVLADGWPDLLDLPTGTGKTSTLDIALYCLARAPERHPRRILLVVDRRIVVDQGAVRARALLERLRGATSGPLAALAARLREIGGAADDEPPFAVAVMRGGMPRDNDWARRPDQPVLGVSTVDQVGSRLLFRGYGVSPRSAAIHAGLLGNDTLFLLDEVHLSVPFAQTLGEIESRYRRAAPELPDRFGVVRMSATPGAHDPRWRVHSLSDEDRRDPVLAPRLGAHKAAALTPVRVAGADEGAKRAAFAQRVAAEARALQERGVRVVAAIVNRVDTAHAVHALLRAHSAGSTDAILVTGRMRPLERDHVVSSRLLPAAGADRTRRAGDRATIVVATQCVEAGADLDFDGMVTECASLDALRQRFGRVDRRGDLARTQSVILGRSDQIAAGADDPVYGGSLAATWEWLTSLRGGGVVDLGVDALPRPVDAAGELRREVLMRMLDAPVLLPTHLDCWSETSSRPVPDPDISLWLHGPKEVAAEVQLVWRDGVKPGTDREQFGRHRGWLLERLALCRPSSLEAVSVPIGAARRLLEAARGAPAASMADVVGGADAGDEAEPRGSRERRSGVVAEEPRALRWSGDERECRFVTADEIEPGDILVLDRELGGLEHGSFASDARGPVVDLGDLAQLRARRIASLRLTAGALEVWRLPDAMLAKIPQPVEDEEPRELAARVREWLAQWPEVAPEGFVGSEEEWEAARRAWSRKPRVQVVGDTIVVTARVPRGAKLGEPDIDEAVSEDEDSSFRAVEVPLREHSQHVRDRARCFARRIGFAEALAEDLELAGWLHDVGKADPRFQRWLVGGDEVRLATLAEPLAKSALHAGSARRRNEARRRAGYPPRYRHELLSVAMIGAREEVLRRAHDPELVLHLVASHHGWCRPFAPPVDHAEEIAVSLAHGEEVLAASTRHGLARLDSGIAERFWALTERYGWWGLAWLEAVLRLADHRASEAEAAEADAAEAEVKAGTTLEGAR